MRPITPTMPPTWCAARRIAVPGAALVLHGDNGVTLQATIVLAMLAWLGIKPSYSRPRVSDDNPYAEALFRAEKYRPEFPAKGFTDIELARSWAVSFVHWYNHDHRHSGTRYVSSAQRHAGDEHAILAVRHALYLQAQSAIRPVGRAIPRLVAHRPSDAQSGTQPLDRRRSQARIRLRAVSV
jgi:hypothetical protein